MAKTIEARVKQKKDTLANWNANTLVLLDGEQAFVVSDSGQPINFKIGDGTKTFAELPFWIQYDQAAFVPVSGLALPTPTQPVGYSILGEGTYTHTSGGFTVPAGHWGVANWDGSAWGFSDMGLMPVAPSTNVISKGNTMPVQSGSVYDELNLGVLKEYPNQWISQTFPTTSSTGYIYYDSRCFVSNKSLLKDVNIKFRQVVSVGDIDLVAISTSGNIIHSETKTGFSSLTNVVKFDDLSSVNEPFYVGIRQNSGGGAIGLKPTTSPGNQFWKPVSSGSFSNVAYDLAYSINMYDGGINGKIDYFQIMLKSDTSKIRESLSKSDFVRLSSGSVVIEDKIEIPSGRTLEGIFGRTVLNIGSSVPSELINVEYKEDVVIKNIKIKGKQTDYAYSMNGINSGTGIIANSTEALSNTYQGSEIGLLAKSSENIILEGIQFHNINGIGMVGDYVGRNYIKGMKASKIFFANCYKGLETRNEHEYSNYTDLMVSLCQIGVDVNSGNILSSGLINTRCRYGTIVRGSGLNHAHGLFSGSEIKHHQLAGLLIDNVEYGQLFDGLMMQYANIVIQNSRLVTIPNLFFSNGSITCTNTDKTGKNIIGNLYRAGGSVTINNTGNLVISNDINLTV